VLIYRQILMARARRWRKAPGAAVPTVCVGNVTVGGTGKTPHTELILGLLQNSPRWGNSQLAMLSRGYKRESRGFQIVGRDSTASFAGDEPLQIARKFPAVTVAVDKDRVEGCARLAGGARQASSEGARQVSSEGARQAATLRPADIIVLDDAFQYNKLHASLNIVLVDWSRPVFEDTLLPFGRLRDLPKRIFDADIIIVTKCPNGIDAGEKAAFAEKLRLHDYSGDGLDADGLPMEGGVPATGSTNPAGRAAAAGNAAAAGCCKAVTPSGKEVSLLFSGIAYLPLEPVYPEGNMRFAYSHKVVLFSGIANDAPLRAKLSDDYTIVDALSFPDHHKYSRADISRIASAVRACPTAALVTTEKDAQRVLDCPSVPAEIRERLFILPIHAVLSTGTELDTLRTALDTL